MAGFTVVILLQISFYFSAAASAPYLQRGGTRLYDSLPNVTMTVGRSDTVFCLYRTAPATTEVTWYNPQGRMVSNSSGLTVHQFIADRGRAAILRFTRYQQRQGGKYECRVTVPGKNTVKLPVCIGLADNTGVTSIPPPTSTTGISAMMSATTELLSITSSQTSSEPSSQSSATPSPTAKPPNKVEDVRVTPTVLDSSPALEVSWQPVAGPGVTYTVKYSTDLGEVNTPPEWASEEVGVSSTFTILTALERATTYYVWVISVSEGVEAPPSNRMYGIVYETPGPVSELSYEETTDTSVTITWTPPKEPTRGTITAYLVEHRQGQNESTASQRIDARVRQPMHTVISGLEPGVPYNITVRAITASGKGEPVSVTVFTVEQAPTVQVHNLKVERGNITTAIVSWSPLTLHQARGFPVYFVAYGAFASNGRMSQALNTTNTNVTIKELEPMQSYWLSVDVATAGGLHRGTRGAVIIILPQNEAESDNTIRADFPATEVGALFGGVIVGALGVLLIVGIVVGASLLRRRQHEFPPKVEAVGEGVPIDRNPAYGEVCIYDEPVAR